MAKSEPKRGRGRPPGKRSDPAWEQISVYLKRDTHRRAKVALLGADDGPRDFSELIEGLVVDWLAARKRR